MICAAVMTYLDLMSYQHWSCNCLWVQSYCPVWLPSRPCTLYATMQPGNWSQWPLCLFLWMSNHNSWTLVVWFSLILVGELDRTTGIFLVWFKWVDFHREIITYRIGYLLHKLFCLILIYLQYNILYNRYLKLEIMLDKISLKYMVYIIRLKNIGFINISQNLVVFPSFCRIVQLLWKNAEMYSFEELAGKIYKFCWWIFIKFFYI